MNGIDTIAERNFDADQAALHARRERVLAQVHAPKCPGIPTCRPKAPWALCGRLRARLREAFGASNSTTGG